MSISFWQQSVSAEPQQFDYIVIGGGIVGVSAAYWYHKMNPDKSIAIVEARSLAAGASGRNAGFVLQGTATNYLADLEKYGAELAGRLYRLTSENRILIEQELNAEAIELQSTGSIVAAGSVEENEMLQASVGPVRAAGGRLVHLSSRDVNRRLNSTNFFGALLVSTGAMVNPVRLVREIAGRSDAVVKENCVVSEVSSVDDRVVVRTESQTFITPRITVALNAYLPTLFPQLQNVVRPVRAQMFATNPVSTRQINYPVYSHNGYYYVRQTKEGRILVGGARHLHVDEERGYEDATTTRLQNDLAGYLATYFPQIKYEGIDRRWSGVMGFSPDGIPSIGEVPGVDGPQYWAAGFTGHGMSIGFLTGRVLADLASGRRPLEMTILDASRFMSNRQTG